MRIHQQRDPVAPCGRNPWHCPHEPTDPECCQSKRDKSALDLGKLFDLLILARNSHDEEALQEAIDLVAVASSRDED